MPIFRPRDKDKFPEGSDAWEALNAGRSIKLDKNGLIVDIWDSKGNHYDVFGNLIPKPPKPKVVFCGSPTTKGHPCRRITISKPCYIHR